MAYNKKNYSLFYLIIGCFFLVFAVKEIVKEIITFTFAGVFLNNIFGSMVILLLSLFMLNYYFTFDDDNLVFHFWFI